MRNIIRKVIIMKKILSVLLLLALLSTFFVPASAASIQRSNTWFCARCGNIGTGQNCSSCYRSRPSGVIGSIVTFGSYKQDSHGKKPIEWIVLDTDGGNALLLSRYILDCMAYSGKSLNASWKSSSVRSWLNGSFYNSAFQASEQSQIVKTIVDNSSRQARDSYVDEEDTVDSIFLLSCTEAFQYLGLVWESGEGSVKNEAAIAPLTDFARAQSEMYTANGSYDGSWWLRSMRVANEYDISAFSVSRGIGCMYYSDVTYTHYGVRPAMWVRM